MANRPVDRRQAAAETQLDRVDDEPLVTAGDMPDLAAVPAGHDPEAMVDDDGFHVDDPDANRAAASDSDLEFDGLAPDDERTDLIDAVVETFNARDLDGLLEVVAADAEAPGLLGYDVADLPAALTDLWRQQPSCLITRGVVDDDTGVLSPIGMLWEHDGERWWRAAMLRIDDVTDGRAGMIELTNEVSLLDRAISDPPGADEIDEVLGWQAWEDGGLTTD